MNGAKHDSTGSCCKVGHDTEPGVHAHTGGTDTGSAVEAGGGLCDTGRPVQADREAGVDAGQGADARPMLREATVQAYRNARMIYQSEPGDIVYTHTTAMNLVIQAVHSAHGKAEHTAAYNAMQALFDAGILPVVCPQCHRDLYVSGPECRGHCTACEQRGI